MDKKVIFAVAGSGKTTYLVDALSCEKRTLIVTYTTGNYDNLCKKIAAKFNGDIPKNITILRYFPFLYSFCYKPFLADITKARGILFDQEIIHQEQGRKKYAKMTHDAFYMTDKKYFYSNRLSFHIENNILDDVKNRIEKYFDELFIDEIQDIAGRDFNFLENIMTVNVNMIFVGDFYQHTFDTSRDGNVNKNLFADKTKYETRFKKRGILIDNTTLRNSWRCSENTCRYIRDNLGISISSNRADSDNTAIEYITDKSTIDSIYNDAKITKFHYSDSAKFGIHHKNWGDSKGEDHHKDICVVLNKTTADKLSFGKLVELPNQTKNKLYVAITRAHGNVFLVDESSICPNTSRGKCSRRQH